MLRVRGETAGCPEAWAHEEINNNNTETRQNAPAPCSPHPGTASLRTPLSRPAPQGAGRRGPAGSSPSYLGSEPSAGKSMAGGEAPAPCSSCPASSWPGGPPLPPSIAGHTPGFAPAAPPGTQTHAEVATLGAEAPPPRLLLEPAGHGGGTCRKPHPHPQGLATPFQTQTVKCKFL